MAKYAQEDEVLYHIGLSRKKIEHAKYVLLPGDPGRVESIARAFDAKAKHLNTHREYTSYLADFHGEKVLVCSTGMGCPSTGIAVEELAMLGVEYFLRVGSCGGLQDYTNVGDVVISSGAVRLEGTSVHHAPIEYPAVPSIEYTSDVIVGAKFTGVPYHVGITATSDTFWQGQERYDSFTGKLLRMHRGSVDEWRDLNVINLEMEASALFVICSIFGLHAASICGVVVKRTVSEEVTIGTTTGSPTANAIKVAVAAVHASMKRRGKGL